MKATEEALTQQLERALGAAVVQAQPSAAAYGVDGLAPRWAVLPESPQAIADLLAIAREHRLGIVAMGGRSKIDIGEPPSRYDVALSLGRMNSLLEHDAPNFIAGAAAGMTINAFNEALSASGQTLRLDPRFPDRATVGGVLATRDAGPKRLLYGAARDTVVGVRVVLPDGSLIKSGGKMVKDVAGYDLRKLFIGSFGTLGVIVSAYLRLMLEPEEEGALWAAFDDLEQAAAYLAKLLASRLTPSALELVNRGWVASQPAAMPNAAPAACYVVLAAEGIAEEVQRHLKEAEALASASGCREVAPMSKPGWQALWMALRQWHAQLAPQSLLGKLSLPTSELAKAAQAAERLGEEGALDCLLAAHAGSGILYAAYAPRQAVPAGPGPLVYAAQRLSQVAGAVGGGLLLEKAPPEVKSRLSVWGPERPDWRLMRHLKATLDPEGLLSPGRLVGAEAPAQAVVP